MNTRYKSLCLLVVFSIGFALVAYRVKSNEFPRVVFEHSRTRAISNIYPKFTQIKRVTLRQMRGGVLEISMQMAAPIALQPGDRYVAEVHMLTDADTPYKSMHDPKQAIIVFPLGAAYPDHRPYVAAGSADVLAVIPYGPSDYGYESFHDYKSFGKTQASIRGSILTATFSSAVVGHSNRDWANIMLVALVRYASAKDIAKSKKAQFSMRSAIVDVEKLSPLANESVIKSLYP